MLISHRPPRKTSQATPPSDADGVNGVGTELSHSRFRFARARTRGQRPMNRLLAMVASTPLQPFVAAFAGIPTVPVPIERDAVEERIAALDAAVRAGATISSERGHHLDLAGREIADVAILRNLDLRYARFRGAVLQGQQFGASNVAEADFRDADLSDADLSQVTGLLPQQLSGADLSRCKLPADVVKFSALENVGVLSQNAGKIFVTAILSCIFVLLTTFTTRDIQLLTNSGTAELPALGVSVSTKLFFGIAPLVLLILSVAVHLYLQRLWETMSQLPAVFPDGETVDNKTYPWLVNDLVRVGFPILSRERYRSSLSWLQLRSFAAIAYGGVPFTLVSVFFRCLSRHDDPLSLWQTVVTALSVSWACAMMWLHRTTLERADDSQTTLIRYSVGVFATPTLLFIAVTGVGWLLTMDSCSGTPILLSKAQRQLTYRWTKGHPTRNAGQRIDAASHVLDAALPSVKLASTRGGIVRERALLTEADGNLRDIPLLYNMDTRYAAWKNSTLSSYALSRQMLRVPEIFPAPFASGSIVEDTTQLSGGWKPGPDTDYPNPPLPRAVVRSGDDVYVNTSLKISLKSEDYYVPGSSTPAYDHDAREWHDRLTAAVKRSSFQGMNLRFLKAHGAFLVSADFRGAVMTGIDFSDHTDLRNAIFDASRSGGALLDFASLEYAKLDGAGLAYASLTGVNLGHASLIGADLTNAVLTGADLSGAKMIGAGLSGAHLRGANMANTNLITANVSGADMIGADLTGAHLIGGNASRVDLSAALLTGAKLEGANLSGASLIGTNAAKLTTEAADFSDVDLSGANLTGADFTKAVMSGARLDDADLTKATFAGAHLDGVSLVDAYLSSANLTGVDLSDADLTNACYPALQPPTWPNHRLPSGWIVRTMPASAPRAGGRTDLMELIPTDQ